MLFSSLEFLYLFLPLSLIIYFLAPKRVRNAVLLVESLVFYAYGEIRMLWVMLLAILLNFVSGLLIFRAATKKVKRLTLGVAVGLNIALLGFFKYTDFLLENIGLSPLGIVLPLGISFYIFQAMSYVCDVYRGAAAQRSLIDFGAYVTMFPQLVAGPIVRYCLSIGRADFPILPRGSASSRWDLPKRSYLPTVRGRYEKYFWAQVTVILRLSASGRLLFSLLFRSITISEATRIWPSDSDGYSGFIFRGISTILIFQGVLPISGGGGI